MQIRARSENQIGILTPQGSITAQTVAEVKKHLEIYIENIELRGLILDCSEVEYIDSAGLGLVASVYKTMQKLNKKLALAHVNTRIMETLTLTNLNTILVIFDNVEAALKSVS